MLIVCHEKQPLASGCLPKRVVLFYLFTQFLEFVSHKLNFRTDDNLHCRLAGPDHTRNACGFDLLLVYCRIVPYLKTKSCNTVVKRCNVLLTAKTFQNDGCHFCKIAVGQNCLLLCFNIVIFSAPVSLNQTSQSQTGTQSRILKMLQYPEEESSMYSWLPEASHREPSQ